MGVYSLVFVMYDIKTISLMYTFITSLDHVVRVLDRSISGRTIWVPTRF